MVVDTLEHIRTGIMSCGYAPRCWAPMICASMVMDALNTPMGLCTGVVCLVVLGLYDLCKYGRGYPRAQKGIAFVLRVVSNK